MKSRQRALLRQGERVEGAAAGDLDPDGDRVAGGNVGRSGAESHRETADRAIEIGGDILFGQREHGERLGLGRQGHAPLFDLHLLEHAEGIKGIAAALVGERNLKGEVTSMEPRVTGPVLTGEREVTRVATP